ncbi:MAG: DUF47 domain-containing protein [Thermoplasmatota archaeon]
MGLRDWLIPQDRHFYDLLEKHAHYAGEAIKEFRYLLGHWTSLETERQKMKEVENLADHVGHEIFERLNRTFITPIDREDLARLTHALDDVVDSIYAATNRLVLYDIPGPTREMSQFADILDAQVREMAKAIAALRHARTMAQAIPPLTVEIHRLENEADQLLNTTAAALFRTNDAVKIIKYKEIYDYLERATDRCEDVADVLSDVTRKHS